MKDKKDLPQEERELFKSRRGFILSCIGSAVGMGNIWLFPTRISAYGGATFLIPYLIFVLLIASTGIIEEMSLGRATHKGPIGAFGEATNEKFGSARAGRIMGLLPTISALAMAIGYSVVVGWIFAYTFGSLTGSYIGIMGAEAYQQQFADISSNNTIFQIIAMVVVIGIMIFGIGKGVEKAHEIMMPLFFIMFIGLAIYVLFLPGAGAGYEYIFLLNPAGLADPTVWVYALGQAFFSLSVAGNGTLIYGSYLHENEDIPNSAKMVAIFDTIAAMLASVIIIPAMASAGQRLSSGGPGLLFIYLPNLFSQMPGGPVFMIIFFIAVMFGGLTSLINLFEVPVATLQEIFHAKRRTACIIIGVIGLAIGLAIQQIVSPWMDVCSIYLCPLGAFLAALCFYWFFSKKRAQYEMNQGRKKPLSNAFYYLGKYVYCGVTIIVLFLGIAFGGIG